MSISEQNLAVQHLTMAAEHLEKAVTDYREAAKYFDAGHFDKGTMHAFSAKCATAIAKEHGNAADRSLALEERPK